MKNNKIFITCTARGGATVVGKMLSANTAISVANCPFLEIFRLQRNLVLNRFYKKKISI